MKFRKTISKSLKLIVSSNLSPKKLALTIALGISLGVIPLLWGASLLCIVVAWVFRLNQICLQVVNYLSWPLQLALLIPFNHLGEWLLTGWQPHLPEPGALHVLARLGSATVKALAAWLLVAPPSSLFLYLLLARIFIKKVSKESACACNHSK